MKRRQQKFAVLLRAARERAGMSQTELARALDITPQRISALEAGVRQNPQFDTIKALAHALGISVSELIGEHFQEKSSS